MQQKVEEMEDQVMTEESLPEVADVKTKELTLTGGIIPKDFDELTRFASLVHKSRLAPKGFDTVEKVAIGMLTNMELGRPIITGLQDLAIINGRCGIYGDASLAMVTASGLMDKDYPISKETGTPYTDDWTFSFTVKRIGRPEETGTWSWLDAKRAGFDAPKTKDGREDKWSPWTRFTKRMMQWKARNFVMRDNFGDVLKGMKTVEDLHDLDPIPLTKQSNGSYSDEPGTAADLTEKIKEAKQDEVPDKYSFAPCPYCHENIQFILLANNFVCPACNKEGRIEDGQPVAGLKKHKAQPGEAPCPYCQKDIQGEIDLRRESGLDHFMCPHCNKGGRIEDGKPIGSFSPDHTARNSEEYQEPKVDFKAGWDAWRKEWIKLQAPGFSTYYHKNLAKFEVAPSELKEEARVKWLKLYPDTPWPLDAPPETEENQKREKQKDDAYDSLSKDLGKMPPDVVMKAKKDIGVNKILGTLSLEELEALVKRCKELQKDVVENQRIAMIDAIKADYTPEERRRALNKHGHETLRGCSLTELGAIYDFLRKGEGGEDLA